MTIADPVLSTDVDGDRLSQPALSSRHASRTWRRLIVVGVVLLAAIGFLLYKGLTSAIVYFKTAQQAIEQRATIGDATFQIEGIVYPGSVQRFGPGTIRFSIYSGKVHVKVENDGSPPQLFGSNVPVVLVGHFVGSTDVFSSNQILVKHSNQYIAAHRNRVKAPNGSVH